MLLEFTPSAKTPRGEFKQRFIMGAGGEENQFIMIEDELTEQIIGAAIEVHKHWGPGLYEEIYEKSLCVELRLRNMSFENQLSLPLIYKGEQVGNDLRLDFVVQNKVVVEFHATGRSASGGKSGHSTGGDSWGTTVDLYEIDEVPGWTANQFQCSDSQTGAETDGAMKSLVFLHNTAGFVKFEISAPLISDLTKSPLFLSPCFRASVVSFSLSAGRNNLPAVLPAHIAARSAAGGRTALQAGMVTGNTTVF
jgi:GxxExxY protein